MRAASAAAFLGKVCPDSACLGRGSLAVRRGSRTVVYRTCCAPRRASTAGRCCCVGLFGLLARPGPSIRPADYGEEKNSVERTQKFRRKSGILIPDETNILNSRPYAKNGENRRKNHGEEDDFPRKDEMRKNLFRPFREIPILAVIFRPPEVNRENRRDSSEFNFLNFVWMPAMTRLVIMVRPAARLISRTRVSWRNGVACGSSSQQDSFVRS